MVSGTTNWHKLQSLISTNQSISNNITTWRINNQPLLDGGEGKHSLVSPIGTAYVNPRILASHADDTPAASMAHSSHTPGNLTLGDTPLDHKGPIPPNMQSAHTDQPGQHFGKPQSHIIGQNAHADCTGQQLGAPQSHILGCDAIWPAAACLPPTPKKEQQL